MSEEQKGERKSVVTLSVKQFLLIVACIAATVLLIYAGWQMLGIQSVAGNTIAEAFYHAMGWGFIGLGILGGGLSIGLALKS